MLFSRCLRLSRTVRQSWDRNIDLEVQVRELKEKNKKYQRHLQVLSKTRQSLSDLKKDTLSVFKELREGQLMVKQLLNTFVQQTQATRNDETQIQDPQANSSETSSQESNSTNPCYVLNATEQNRPRCFSWMYGEQDLSAWYATSALSLFEC